MKELNIKILMTLLLTVFAAPVNAQDYALGDWYGSIETPVGVLTLIITIERDDDGNLQAELESPDQAPGQKIPISSITITDGHLSFAVTTIGASYEGDWVEATQRWDGTFKQGTEFPLTFSRGKPAAKPVIEGMDGFWEGGIMRNGQKVQFNITVRSGENGTTASFGSPDFAVSGLPVADFSRDGNTVSFSVPATGARYSGMLATDGNSMTGIWKFPGRPDGEVVFVRTREIAERAPRVRPQLPTEPFGYRTEDVTFDNPLKEAVTLAGTLTLPEGNGPFPAAILISGSGPQDRDETVFSHKPFAVLADHLTKAGIAVLRYDDRGFAQSTGDHGTANSADFATDANAAARYLMARPEIIQNAIGFVGHSEGGMIGPIAMADNKDIAFLVMLAGPGTKTSDIIRFQTRLLAEMQGTGQEKLNRQDAMLAEIFAIVEQSTGQEDATEKLDSVLTPEMLATLGGLNRGLAIQQYTSNWFRYFLQYDAADFLSDIAVPVLAINGSLDLQVPADENLAGIRAVLAHNPDVTIQKLEGLNHLFQTAKTGTMGEYAEIEETFSPDAMTIVADWINKRFGGR